MLTNKGRMRGLTFCPCQFLYVTSMAAPETSGAAVFMSEKRKQTVYTLIVEVGRKPGDGLPDGATGAALMCYASGVDEAEAVRETVAILKQADLAPLDVTGYGTLEDRLALGHEVPAEERDLMDRALAENSVIVAQLTPYFDKPEDR